MNQYPQESIRTLAHFVVMIFDIAWSATREVMEHVRPLVDPPRGLRIIGGKGAQYSGLLVVDRGAVIAGIVVQTGHDAVAAAGEITQPRQPPFDDHVHRYRDESRLPGWADDPRSQYDDGSPWHR